MKVSTATTDDDIIKCRDVLMALRPHLIAADFLTMIREMLEEGYQLAFIEEAGKAAAAIGFRRLRFLYNGTHFYIDDLSTLPGYRGKGYAGVLLDFVTDKAKAAGYSCVALDSGYMRTDAHRLYLNKGFILDCHHFSKKI